MPSQTVTGSKTISDPPFFPADTVMKTGLAMAVSVNNLLHFVALCHLCKATVFFKDIGGRIVEEHDEFPIAVRPGQLKGCLQSVQFPVHQLDGMVPGILSFIAKY